MLSDPVYFFLVKDHDSGNPKADLEKITGYLKTVDGVKADIKNKGEVEISYDESPIKAFVKTGATSRQLMLTCERQDNVAVNLLRSVVPSTGYRIYNPIFKCFMVNELNLMDLTTIPLAPFLKEIFKKNGLEPLFQYRSSMVFYARNLKNNTIHLVNNHLVSFFLENNKNLRKLKEMSVEVAPDIATFVALFDRGLIPTSFYRTYLYPKAKIVNLNGFDFEKLNQDIFFTPIFFKLDKEKQAFKQVGSNERKDFLKKGASATAHIKKAIKSLRISGDYISSKIAPGIDYEMSKKDKIIPRMTFIIFMT